GAGRSHPSSSAPEDARPRPRQRAPLPEDRGRASSGAPGGNALMTTESADRVPESSQEPTLFEWAGGLPALTRMTRIFYGKYVPEDPLLSALFADMAPDHPER